VSSSEVSRETGWTRCLCLCVAAALALAAPGVRAEGDLLEMGRDLLKGTAAQPQKEGAGELSAGQASSGLREALRVAAQRTVARVGKPDGFLKDPAIHIPLPGYLEQARSALGAVGAGSMLDDLDVRMNRAAEEASAKAFDVFAGAISKMSITDAKNIVAGEKDAATRYLRENTSTELTKDFRPIVDRTLAESGAMKVYNAAAEKASSSLGGLGSLLGGDAGQGARGFDFTGFVVGKALDGIFHYVAEEEAAIRADPVKRTTELLKQVFGRS